MNEKNWFQVIKLTTLKIYIPVNNTKQTVSNKDFSIKTEIQSKLVT